MTPNANTVRAVSFSYERSVFSGRLPSVCNEPFDRHTIGCLGNAIQLHCICPLCNPQMQRDISGCWDDTGTLRGTPQREAVPLTKLEDVRDVAAIRDQARITVQRQYDLLICKREIIIVVPDAGYSNPTASNISSIFLI